MQFTTYNWRRMNRRVRWPSIFLSEVLKYSRPENSSRFCPTWVALIGATARLRILRKNVAIACCRSGPFLSKHFKLSILKFFRIFLHLVRLVEFDEIRNVSVKFRCFIRKVWNTKNYIDWNFKPFSHMFLCIIYACYHVQKFCIKDLKTFSLR